MNKLPSTEITEIANFLNVDIKDIVPSPFNDDIILIENKIGYKIVYIIDKDKKGLEALKSLGSTKYFFNDVSKVNNDIIVQSLDVECIQDIDLFVDACTQKIQDEFLCYLHNKNIFDYDQGAFEDYISSEYSLSLDDLNNPSILWEYIWDIPLSFEDFNTSIFNVFGVNEDVVLKVIYDTFFSHDIISNYQEYFLLNDKLCYKVDAEYIK